MPTKWLQERTNGSKNEPVIGFEGPGVDPTRWIMPPHEDVAAGYGGSWGGRVVVGRILLERS